MRLSAEQVSFIDKYVHSDKTDKTKLISYLERNRIVNQDIFSYCSIKTHNPGSVSFSDERSGCGELIINASPETVIYTRGLPYHDDSSPSEVIPSESCEWKQIYAGPRHMFFNHHVLKQLRLSKGMTQQDVALAIDASVRTYQKWEAGETTPDCQNLIRIMNWLDIPNIQHLISYAHIR